MKPLTSMTVEEVAAEYAVLNAKRYKSKVERERIKEIEDFHEKRIAEIAGTQGSMEL